jgi:hypothetical protein
MRLILWTAPTRQIHGLRVAVTSRDPQLLDLIWTKVEEALLLLQRQHPRGYRTVMRQVRRVIVGFSPINPGRWHHRLRLCFVSIEWYAQPRTSAADLASTLLHEATHGRLENLGYRYTPRYRVRLEAICTRAEMELAAALPDAATRQAALAERLEQMSVLYSDVSISQWKLQALRKLGAPVWLLRALERRHRSRAA